MINKLPFVPDDPPNHRLKTLTVLATLGIGVALVRHESSSAVALARCVTFYTVSSHHETPTVTSLRSKGDRRGGSSPLQVFTDYSKLTGSRKHIFHDVRRAYSAGSKTAISPVSTRSDRHSIELPMQAAVMMRERYEGPQKADDGGTAQGGRPQPK